MCARSDFANTVTVAQTSMSILAGGSGTILNMSFRRCEARNEFIFARLILNGLAMSNVMWNKLLWDFGGEGIVI